MERQQSFKEEKESLYVIATPIGNLDEITYRMVETLKKVDVIFCEDTRVSIKILQHLGIKKPLYSAYENKELEAAKQIIELIEKKQNVALLSDAGYPGISDPGQKIIQQAILNHINVIVINGPNACIQSLVASGFSTEHFYFHGFLDAKQSKRIKELESLKEFEFTMVFYQSPHKVKETLHDMLTIFQDRNICLCRELTKKFEEYVHGTINEVLSIVDTLKGEMVLVVEGKKKEKITINQATIQLVDEKIKQGLTKMQAIKEVAKQLGVSKNELYNYYHIGG